MTHTLTVTEFLLARIQEDEDVADGVAPPSRDRWLAECKAKRRLVILHDQAGGRCAECGHASPCDTLWILASPYSDHPDHPDRRP